MTKFVYLSVFVYKNWRLHPVMQTHTWNFVVKDVNWQWQNKIRHSTIMGDKMMIEVESIQYIMETSINLHITECSQSGCEFQMSFLRSHLNSNSMCEKSKRYLVILSLFSSQNWAFYTSKKLWL